MADRCELCPGIVCTPRDIDQRKIGPFTIRPESHGRTAFVTTDYSTERVDLADEPIEACPAINGEVSHEAQADRLAFIARIQMYASLSDLLRPTVS